MDTLTEIVKTVLLIIIVASFLELLLPESGLKSFVSFTMGLFILIAILNPILNFAFKERDFDINFWDYKYDQALENKMLDKGLDINQQFMKNNDQQIQDKLQGQISALVSLVPGVQEVETRIEKDSPGNESQTMLFVQIKKTERAEQDKEMIVFGDNEEEKQVSQEEQNQIENKILTLLNNMYGLKNEQIKIIIEGGNS